MSDQRKPPSGKDTPKALLDELSSIQSLLGEGGKDVPLTTLDGQAPELTPRKATDVGNQMPLLGDGSRPTSSSPLSKALSERENPFLPRKPQHTPSAAPAIPTPPPRHRPPTQASGQLSETQMRALVDEALAEWLPKIERDLRNRLMEKLRRDNL
jgi:hypothetical protein